MKKVILFVLVLTGSFDIISQTSILPVEKLNEVTGKVHEQIGGITYIKDVNGVLDKFEGRWKVTFSIGEIEIKNTLGITV